METWLTIGGILVFFAGFFITAIVVGCDMTAFLKRTPELHDEADMDAYRRVVGHNMLAALLMLMFGVPALLLAGVAFYMEFVNWLVLALLLLACSSLSVSATVWTNSLETRLKNIPTADDEMRAERDRVVEVWHKKMLPDW